MIKIKVKFFSSNKERFFGLIPYKKAIPALFYTHFGIHTFGLRFPIDVLVLNDKNEVASMRKNLKPNRIYL